MADIYSVDNVPDEYDPQWLADELSRIAAAFQPVAGVWTPELWDSSYSGNEGQTYDSTNTNGTYRKVGDMVFIRGRIEVTGLGSLATGQPANIGNLPFAVKDDEDFHFPISIGWAQGLNITAGQALAGYCEKNRPAIRLRRWDSAGGNSNLYISEFSATGELIFSGWYITDEL